MVMMEKPSPNQVGSEFVRQYYTLLNKAPALLHRFYSTQSSYVHGGKYCDGKPEKPVIGQSEIHQKIDSLNFQDCHTKIRQVDALSTIGNGVVVQVTGELSNSGHPLRRFMQTFVLAPQGDNPFKFYVHNDIFRYQDEVFNDDVQVEHSDEEQEVEVEQEQPIVDGNHDDNYYQQPVTHEFDHPAPGMTNGIERLSDEPDADQQDTAPSPEVEDNAAESLSPCPSPTPPPAPEQTVEPVVHQAAEQTAVKSEPEEVDLEPAEPKSSKPISWADLASKNTPITKNQVQQPGTMVKTNKPPPVPTEPAEADDSSRPARPRNQRPRDEDRGGVGDRPDNVRRGGFGPGNSVRYPDNQQIFIGNLPFDMTDADLREHFADFGSVLEVRINHSHTNNPNFGFVIFADPKSVTDVLHVMPTHCKNGHRINIEEKKQRANQRDGGNRRMGDMRRGGMGDGNRINRRLPMRRDRQGSREGPRPNNYAGPRR